MITFANTFTTSTLNEAVIRSKCQDKELQKSCEQPSEIVADSSENSYKKAISEAEYQKSPAGVKQIVQKCNIHNHSQSCRKYGDECRFDFPLYPIWETIMTRPFRIFGENEENSWKKYKDILRDVKKILNDKETIQKILEEIPISPEENNSVEIYRENRMKRISLMLDNAGHKNKEQLYKKALQFSKNSYTIIRERCISEIYVNSYNVEWTRAWNGNIDLQVCLDYYAVIGYITEYYQKIDPGLLKKLIELLKKAEYSNLQESMRTMMNNYISARQMGECEALWRIMPDFHLKDSDTKVIFIPTCKPEERSKFLVRIDEKTDYNGKEKKIIANREGLYVEKYSVIDKYVQRDKDCPEIENLSAAQFFKMYSPSWKTSEDDSEECFENESNENLTNFWPDATLPVGWQNGRLTIILLKHLKLKT